MARLASGMSSFPVIITSLAPSFEGRKKTRSTPFLSNILQYLTKLALGWWSSTMGFSKNWKALGMVVVVLFPYLTVTVISAPKCSL
ncbi:hypothetical protein EYF80_013771 [Liparis tanakae]|uniref:Uncharacterized protein n=1 Tax=Liparis tanakae TaxID=230148 RepID=A0A4Z2IDD7_9TELE|nr:hypothetical protein EYF80_013771 [Liparis tanakae]